MKEIKKHLVLVFITAILLSSGLFFLYSINLEKIQHQSYHQDAEMFIMKAEIFLLKSNDKIEKDKLVKYIVSLDNWNSKYYNLIIKKDKKILFTTLKDLKSIENVDFNQKQIKIGGMLQHIEKNDINDKDIEIIVMISRDGLYSKILLENRDAMLYLFLLFLVYILIYTYVSHSLTTFLGKSKTTGLRNTEKLFEIIRKTDKTFVIITLDVRNFSDINHGYGLEIGDKLLREMGTVLKKLIGDKDILFHVSGDRFIIYKENYTSASLSKLIEDIVAFTHNNFFYVEELELKIEFDFAIVENEKDEPLKKSFIALAEAKRSKERIVYYSTLYKKEDEYMDNLKSSQKLLMAVKKELFEPVFQPIINNRSGEIEKFEALVRLVDEETGKFLTPNLFLNQVKEIGKIKDLTRIMIDKVFAKLSGKDFTVSINITEEDFLDKNFVKYVREKLKQYNISSNKVIFEIVESITRSDRVIKVINDLKKLGFLIAIDDFGTEHSNFLRLLELQVDFIKIDGAFIKDINNSYKSYKIVETIVNFANSINTAVVAEFVSDVKIQERVLELKIEYSQGYLISKPKKELSASTTYLISNQ